MQRSSGIFLNISSLMGDFGIGDFNSDAINAVLAKLNKMGLTWWQILPNTMIGEGNSPYSALSAFAGNVLYVDLYSLVQDGYLTQNYVEGLKYTGNKFLVDYEYAFDCKIKALKTAYETCKDKIKPRLNTFVKTNEWVLDYALFMVAKSVYNNKPWAEFDDGVKFRKPEALANLKNQNLEIYYYYIFEQYIFIQQWQKVKQKINESGIKIMGDVPIYVSYDSVDVWANTTEFLLTKTLEPKLVSGVPPDYFSKDGQFWNNPLYDYCTMEANNFLWWQNRIKHAGKMYDGIRLDHFRGFYSFYALKPTAKTAKEGIWLKGPRQKIIDVFTQTCKNNDFICEDLGIVDSDLMDFVSSTGLSNMRVLQFAFEGDNSIHLPHNFNKNMVCYTATHDNNTTLGYLYNADESTIKYIKNYLRIDDNATLKQVLDEMIASLFASVANLIILPVQDFLGYGEDARLNTPGVAKGNWRYRLTYEALSEINESYIYWLNYIYKRI